MKRVIALVFVVAVLLSIQDRDREVDLQVAPIGMRISQAREDSTGRLEVELAHQADAAIVLNDKIVGFAPRGRTRAGDGDEERHRGGKPACSTCKRIAIHGLEGRPV